jgi:hypothetical protein
MDDLKHALRSVPESNEKDAVVPQDSILFMQAIRLLKQVRALRSRIISNGTSPSRSRSSPAALG